MHVNQAAIDYQVSLIDKLRTMYEAHASWTKRGAIEIPPGENSAEALQKILRNEITLLETLLAEQGA